MGLVRARTRADEGRGIGRDNPGEWSKSIIATISRHAGNDSGHHAAWPIRFRYRRERGLYDFAIGESDGPGVELMLVTMQVTDSDIGVLVVVILIIALLVWCFS
jgi:hypothetical protein